MSDFTLLRVAILALGAALGASLASFVGVLVDRLPRGGSPFRPASHCAACRTPLSIQHNIPILSWILLRGRCRRCHVAIPAHLFALEVMGALVGVLLANRF